MNSTGDFGAPLSTGAAPDACYNYRDVRYTILRGTDAGFGAQLGSAFSTIVSASATWVAFACCLWSGSAPAGAVIGGIFGVVRAVPLLANARVRDPRRLRRLLAGMERLRSPITRLVLVLQAALVVLLLASIGVQS